MESTQRGRDGQIGKEKARIESSRGSDGAIERLEDKERGGGGGAGGRRADGEGVK